MDIGIISLTAFAIDGMGVEPTLTASKPALSPAEFSAACTDIVTRLEGDAAHRALDALVTQILSSLGYGEGMAIFLAKAAAHHAESNLLAATQVTTDIFGSMVA